MLTEHTLSSSEALAFSAQLEELGRLDDAEKVLRAVLKEEPKNQQALNRLGGVVFNKGAKFEALYLFERALKISKRYVPALVNRGMVLNELGHTEEAARDLTIATQIEPRNAIAWNNYSRVLDFAGKVRAALEATDRALAIEPDHKLSIFNRGTILGRLGRHAEAVECFERVIAALPDFADAHYNRAIGLLATGRLEEGFREYEWRLKSTEEIYRLPSEAPRWTGEALGGKTIVLWAEQGLGDAIQFMRYAEHLIERFDVRAPARLDVLPAKVLLYVHAQLRSMCGHHFGDGVTILTSDRDLPPHDFHIALMSLPQIFPQIPSPWRPREMLSNCPDCDRWGTVLGPSEKLRVGVCWSGNPNHRNDRNRSIPLDAFAELMSVPGVEFFSLQKEVRSADLKALEDSERLGLRAIGHHLTDMRQTGHAIGNMDLVITVDTAVAHLAASMGTETWVLVPEVCDWRWVGDVSPWYRGVTVFRRSANSWMLPIMEIRRRLETRARQQAAA